MAIDRELMKKLFFEEMERTKRHEEEIATLVRNFHLTQISFLEKNKDRRFEITQEFYDSALLELKKSFKRGEEMGMLIFFREENGNFYSDKFYDSNWVIQNNYGVPGPSVRLLEVNGKAAPPYPVGAFCFVYEKLFELTENQSELVVQVHTHPSLAIPSSGDLEKPYSGMVVGFERISNNLKKLVDETFCKLPQLMLENMKKQENFVHPTFNFPEEFYKTISEECSPTVGFFYAQNKNELNRIPLYVDGRKI